MENNKRGELDAILDDALRGYARAEPLAGLEERILNRTRAAKVSRAKAYWAAVGAAGVLAMVVVFTHLPRYQETLPPPAISTVAVARKPPIAIAPAAAAVSSHRRVRRALPKLEQFPAPEPLTAEERALLHFASRDPKMAAETLASLRSHNAPLEIKPIETTPLAADEVGN